MTLKAHGRTVGALDTLLAQPGPALLELAVAPGHRDDLGRPSSSPSENKRALMQFLRAG